MYSPLPVSYKNKYPFKIGSPSYIYPDHIIPNVKMLAPYLDEIEILLFESKPDSLPSQSDIQILATIAQESEISYNIHLPVDISVTHPDQRQRNAAIDILKKIFDLTAPLNPDTYTLHFPFEEALTQQNISKWKNRAIESLTDLFSHHIPSHILSIETLNYPFSILDDIIQIFDVMICMDIGHLICHGYDVLDFYDQHKNRISIIHLSGVDGHKDHLALNRMPCSHMNNIVKLLDDFHQILSIEVFSYNDLKDSLDFLECRMNQRWGGKS